MKRKLIIIAALSCASCMMHAAACYELEPRAHCSPDDVTPVPGSPPTGNYCVQSIYSPHGYAEYCLDVSSLIEDPDGSDDCAANSVTVTQDYTWFHEVNGRCVDDNQTFRLPGIMIGTCEQDYIPWDAGACD